MTIEFTISEKFDPETREYLAKVVARSNLPENVLVVPFIGVPRENGKLRPLAVVSRTAGLQDMIDAYTAGAVSVARMHLDPEILLENLNLKKAIN